MANLKYLSAIVPSLIPKIRTMTNEYYLIEECHPIEPIDFAPSNFDKLYQGLIAYLHKFKNDDFTYGIYKFFSPFPLHVTCNNQEFSSYLLKEFRNTVEALAPSFPSLLKEDVFNQLYERLNDRAILTNWHPVDGYSLLHGDLHIGNIVKRNDKFLLIDYEYLRYGIPEIEIANLIISALIWFFRKGYDEKMISNYMESYFKSWRAIAPLHFDCDVILINYFYIFSLSLFYLNFYVKSDVVGLTAIIKLFRMIK